MPPGSNITTTVILVLVVAALFYIFVPSSVHKNSQTLLLLPTSNSSPFRQNRPIPNSEQQRWKEFWNSAYNEAYTRSTKPLWDGGVDNEIITTIKTLHVQISEQKKTATTETATTETATTVHILEIGCGEGDNLLALQSLPNTMVYCIDMSSIALSALKKKNNNVHVHEGNLLESLPSTWMNFDIVLMRSVMYHVSPANKILMLRKIETILTVGGFVVDKEYDRKANQQAAATYNSKKPKTSLGPEYSLSKEQMVGLYRSNRFHLWKGTSNKQPSKCYTPYIPNVEYVWCQLMVLQKN